MAEVVDRTARPAPGADPRVPDEAASPQPPAPAGGAAAGERMVADTLAGFSLLLKGSFRREPERQPATALAAAALRIAGLMGVKAQPGREQPGETTAAFLERFGAANGLRSRRLRLEPGSRPPDEGPLLAFSAEGRPLVLVPAGRGYRIEDAFAGPEPEVLPAKALETIRPDVFAFYPTLPDGALDFRAVLGFGLAACRRDIGLIAVAGLLGSLLAMAVPLASAKIADIGVQSRDLAFLAQIMAALALVLVTETAFFVIRQFAELRLEGRSALALHAALADRLLRLPAAALAGSTNLITATQMESVERFRRPLLHLATTGVLALAYGIVAGAVVAASSPAAGLIAIAMVLALAGLTLLLGWVQFKAIYEGERMDVIVLAFVYDLVRLVPQLRALRLERFALAQWGQNFLAFQSRLMRSTRFANALSVAEGPWQIATLAACFVALALAGTAGHMAAGEAIVFVLALGRLLHAGRELSHALMGAAKLLPMAKLARPFLATRPEPRRSGLPVPDISGRVELADVGFLHGGRPVLNGLSLTVEEGAFVAVTGPSGSGKTTLVRLIAGLDQPAAGAVLIGGHDLRSLDRAQVARKLGVVMQNGRLFPGSIYANIRGVTEIDLDEAWHHARLAGLADEMAALPMGLRTLVGEGSGLSRGQVQRILIARALAQRPRVLILDEATASLDGATQARVMRTLAGLDLTRIVVAHRRATLAVADRLVVLGGGRIEDDGRPEEVMARHPGFGAGS